MIGHLVQAGPGAVLRPTVRRRDRGYRTSGVSYFCRASAMRAPSSARARRPASRTAVDTIDGGGWNDRICGLAGRTERRLRTWTSASSDRSRQGRTVGCSPCRERASARCVQCRNQACALCLRRPRDLDRGVMPACGRGPCPAELGVPRRCRMPVRVATPAGGRRRRWCTWRFFRFPAWEEWGLPVAVGLHSVQQRALAVARRWVSVSGRR